MCSFGLGNGKNIKPLPQMLVFMNTFILTLVIWMLLYFQYSWKCCERQLPQPQVSLLVWSVTSSLWIRAVQLPL